MKFTAIARSVWVSVTSFFLLVCGWAQTPLTQREACSRFSGAVVSVDAGGRSHGTGFLVSANGLVLTAAHVVINPDDGQYFSAISITLASGVSEVAAPAIPLTLDNVAQDFAVLKIETKTPLPFLTLGSVEEVILGADATIIGFPFSALARDGKPILNRFCLAGGFAARDLVTVSVSGANRTPAGIVPISKDVKVDVVYFQGPSVKGVSGSPIIARDTGHVVGIVSTKLTGIGSSLMQLKNDTERGLGGGVNISGLNPGQALHDIIAVLDNQLANDLGSATGIDDPKVAVHEAERRFKGR